MNPIQTFSLFIRQRRHYLQTDSPRADTPSGPIDLRYETDIQWPGQIHMKRITRTLNFRY